MERVTYQEHGVTQLENFSMTVWAGEIKGLVPVNHHGLESLIKLLRQNLPIHYGYIYYNEKPVNNWRHSDMKMNRLSVIQNQSCLAEALTVADNIFVLRQGFKKRFMQPEVLRKQLQPFLQDIRMEISADAYVESLSTFERFVVELLKAVVAGNHLVILDDISTFISAAELVKLHEILKHYAAQGMSFLYITRHYEEARQICDRTALMMNGQIIKTFQASDLAPDMFVLQCTENFERHVREQIERKSDNPELPGAVFRVSGLCSGNIRNLSFSVARGECLVLQDMDNEIFQEFIRILSGECRPESGSIRVGGEMFAFRPDRRIAVVQELPVDTMLFPNMSYLDNLCFTLDHRLKKVWLNRRIKNSLRTEYAGLLGEEVFDIPVEDLTESQKYDLIYARILLQNPDIVFCVQPFKSAEVSLRFHIWELLEMLLQKGIAVVILAVNLADSLALADRMIRVQKGKEADSYDRDDFNRLPVDTPWLYLYQKKNQDRW